MTKTYQIEHDNGVDYTVKIEKIDYKVVATSDITSGSVVGKDNTMGVSTLVSNGKQLIKVGNTTPLSLFVKKYDLPTTLYISGAKAKSIYAIAEDVTEIAQEKKLKASVSLFDLVK